MKTGCLFCCRPSTSWPVVYNSQEDVFFYPSAKEHSVYSTAPSNRVGWFVGFYGISTFVGYLTPNPFLCKYSVLFKTIQFSMSILIVKNIYISQTFQAVIYNNSLSLLSCLKVTQCSTSEIGDVPLYK